MASKACAEILKQWRSEMLKRALIVLAVVEFIVTAFVMFYMVKK
jgi:large-conductance mechanosensitive channel